MSTTYTGVRRPARENYWQDWASAIIAVWFYNYFTARLDDITIDIEETASELVDTILRGHPA